MRSTAGRAFFAIDLAVNFLAPWLLYRASRPHVDETHAIMISACAPAIWGLVQFARSRKVDAFSVLSLGGIALSFAIFALGGSPKVLLMRESLIIGVIGVAFVVSALIGRPLMLELVRGIVNNGSVPAAARDELETYASLPWFRRLMTTMTVAFGIFGVIEMGARMTLAFVLPTERYFLVAPIVRYGIAGLMMAWVFFYILPAFRRQKARTG
ncbi:MAG TPA: VC0807 family protein [Candidatus Acidoferrales bacterium]|nr:VC0807 family protein [Candidatus Acidoferrales bacterium]